MAKTKYQTPLFLYDHECTLCNRFKSALEKLPGSEKITMVSVREKEIYEEYSGLDIKECHEVAHFIDEDGKIYKGSEVIKQLVQLFPAVSKFAWLLETDMGKKAVDFFYDVANKYREKTLKDCKACNQKGRKKHGPTL